MYFAELINNIVIQVIVSEEKPEGNYVETFKDTKGKNYASIGDSYIYKLENFCSPQPYKSWKLNNDCLWQPPKEYPTDGKRYSWNEELFKWVEIKTI